jgi:hypothetical protein
MFSDFSGTSFLAGFFIALLIACFGYFMEKRQGFKTWVAMPRNSEFRDFLAPVIIHRCPHSDFIQLSAPENSEDRKLMLRGSAPSDLLGAPHWQKLPKKDPEDQVQIAMLDRIYTVPKGDAYPLG